METWSDGDEGLSEREFAGRTVGMLGHRGVDVFDFTGANGNGMNGYPLYLAIGLAPKTSIAQESPERRLRCLSELCVNMGLPVYVARTTTVATALIWPSIPCT